MDVLETVEPLTAAVFALSALALLTLDARWGRLHGDRRHERFARTVGWLYLLLAATMAGALARGATPWGAG